jgi:hypothetical protein
LLAVKELKEREDLWAGACGLDAGNASAINGRVDDELSARTGSLVVVHNPLLDEGRIDQLVHVVQHEFDEPVLGLERTRDLVEHPTELTVKGVELGESYGHDALRVPPLNDVDDGTGVIPLLDVTTAWTHSAAL